MAVRIRMKRMGSKKRPFYRVVVADGRAPRDGRFIEEIGYYNPIDNEKLVSIDHERALYWMGNGAKPSETVEKLFRRVGVMEAFEAQRQEKAAAREEKKEVTENVEIEDQPGSMKPEEVIEGDGEKVDSEEVVEENKKI